MRAVAGDAAADDVELRAFGSAVYAPAHAADTDLVMRTGACPAHELAALLADAHGLALHGPPWRLRGALAGRPLDLIVVAGDEPDAERWLAGPRDAELLRDHLRDHGRDDAFLAAWPHVRAFARPAPSSATASATSGASAGRCSSAIPLCHDARLCAAPAGHVLAPWLRWLGALHRGTRVGFDELRARRPRAALPRRARTALAQRRACGDRRHRGHAVRRAAPRRAPGRRRRRSHRPRGARRVAVDLADDPPPGVTLVIRGGEPARGRYEGVARRLIGELEAANLPLRVWGRFEPGEPWEHRISVPAPRAAAALATAEVFLGVRPRAAPALTPLARRASR